MAEKNTEARFEHVNDIICETNDKKQTQIKTQWLRLAFSHLDSSMRGCPLCMFNTQKMFWVVGHAA